MPDLIKVVVIEDIREVREGLTTLINGTPGFRCSGSYRTMEEALRAIGQDRKSTRLNSSHLGISYAVFCLKKKIKRNISTNRNNLISGVKRCIHLNAMKNTTITSINCQTIII